MKKKIVVLTGAGMSAESGIKTFRDSDGLWEEYRIEEVATPQAFLSNPQLVLDFYNYRRKELIKAEPNQGHLRLKELEKDFNVQIVTQNIDDLHERAGSQNVLHLHGELLKVRSIGTGELFELTPNNIEIKVGSKCPDGFQLRPHVVWFGEAVPELENAIPFFQNADICVIIGTSLQVYPASGLIDYLPSGTPIYVIDPKKVDVQAPNLHFINKGAVEGTEELVGLLKRYK